MQQALKAGSTLAKILIFERIAIIIQQKYIGILWQNHSEAKLQQLDRARPSRFQVKWYRGVCLKIDAWKKIHWIPTESWHFYEISWRPEFWDRFRHFLNLSQLKSTVFIAEHLRGKCYVPPPMVLLIPLPAPAWQSLGSSTDQYMILGFLPLFRPLALGVALDVGNKGSWQCAAVGRASHYDRHRHRPTHAPGDGHKGDIF